MSNDAITKLRVKFGAAEIDYEGNEALFTQEVMPLVGKMLDVVQQRVELQRVTPAIEQQLDETGGAQVARLSASEYSTNTIATILEAKTGPDLAVAAVARLIIVGGKETVTRNEILEEMKSATSFYNTNMSGNLSKILKALATDKLRLVGNNTYGLAQKERIALEQKIAQNK